jgi:hypothetical protein
VIRFSFQDRLKLIRNGNEAKMKPKLDRFENHLFSEETEAQLLGNIEELDRRLIT